MQRAEEKSSPAYHPSFFFFPAPQSLLPSFCLFLWLSASIRSAITHDGTTVATCSTSLGVQTLSPGERQPEQSKRQLCSLDSQSEAKMHNICIWDDSQLQVVWLIQLMVRARWRAWSLWMLSLWGLKVTSPFHLRREYCTPGVNSIMSARCGQTAKAVILLFSFLFSSPVQQYMTSHEHQD